MLNYDYNLISRLWNSSSTLEGGIFNNEFEKMRTQVEFIEGWLDTIKPKRIVEIGTNKSNFVYIALNKFPSLTIDTFDIDIECENGINILKNIFTESMITFHCVDSKNLSCENLQNNSPVDLFYVDGHHSYKMAYNDLMIAINIDSKFILVDDLNDVGDNGGVLRAVDDTLYEFGYKLLDKTSEIDDRGMAIFSK